MKNERFLSLVWNIKSVCRSILGIWYLNVLVVIFVGDDLNLEVNGRF